MKALFTFQGKKKLCEVHEPLMDSYSVKVRLHYSAISFGTENLNRQGTKIFSQLSNKELWKKGLKTLKETKSLFQIWKKFQGIRNTYNAIGYSAVGEVLEVGKNVKQVLKKGDIVHVGGERSCHAQVVVCPQNFVFKLDEAQYEQYPFLYALPTIISVPMHAFLHAKNALLQDAPHEVLVIGGGLVGTFAGLIAKQHNMRVRFEDCQSAPLASCFFPPLDRDIRYDLLLCCATSSEGLSNYIPLCREGAVLSLIGEIPLQLDRSLLEDKYMTVRFCKSFGYGRGNQAYEYGLERPNPSFPLNVRNNIQKSIEFVDVYKQEIMNGCVQLIEPQDVQRTETPQKINVIQWLNLPF